MLYGGMPYYNWWESAEEVGGVWFSERVGGWGCTPFCAIWPTADSRLWAFNRGGSQSRRTSGVLVGKTSVTDAREVVKLGHWRKEWGGRYVRGTRAFLYSYIMQ